MRGATIRPLIGEVPIVSAFNRETRPQGHHCSGFLECAATAGRFTWLSSDLL